MYVHIKHRLGYNVAYKTYIAYNVRAYDHKLGIHKNKITIVRHITTQTKQI